MLEIDYGIYTAQEGYFEIPDILIFYDISKPGEIIIALGSRERRERFTKWLNTHGLRLFHHWDLWKNGEGGCKSWRPEARTPPTSWGWA